MAINLSLLKKFLNLALDPAAQAGEAQTATKKFMEHMKAEGAKFDDLVTQPKIVYVDRIVYQDKIVDKIVYVDKPVEKIVHVDINTMKPVLVMPFGKHKGLSIVDVANKDPNYLYWVLENCDRIDKALQIQICQILDVELEDDPAPKKATAAKKP